MPLNEAIDAPSDGAGGGPDRPDLRLRELIRELSELSADVDLDLVLERTVRGACGVTGARYGAIGVLDASGSSLASFITFGVDEGTRADIGAPPTGRGLLGHLIRDPRPLRLDNLSEHPAAAGFPPSHPPMRSFLGVPLRVGEDVFGLIYLTEKEHDRPFTEADEDALLTFLAAAGPAVSNARQFIAAQGRAMWADAVAALAQTLLEGRRESAALARMAKRARELGGAAGALVAMCDEAGQLRLEAVESSGRWAAPRLETGKLLEGLNWQRVVRMRAPLTLMEMPEDQRVGELVGEIHRLTGATEPVTALVVPLAVGDEDLGLMCLVWPTSEGDRAMDTMDVLPEFAENMSLAIETGRAQRQRSRSRLLEERDRIARDMHDHVIQRLFAAGLSLQVVARRSAPEEKDRIGEVVEELNDTVQVLRAAITGLHRHLPEGGLGPEIEALVEAAADAGGFVPDLSIEGRLREVPPELEYDVLAVVREGLSNMVRHSGAGDASVAVQVLDEIVITIADDGVGVGDSNVRSGLANLAERARVHQGSFTVFRGVPQGTVLRWRVPLG